MFQVPGFYRMLEILIFLHKCVNMLLSVGLFAVFSYKALFTSQLVYLEMCFRGANSFWALDTLDADPLSGWRWQFTLPCALCVHFPGLSLRPMSWLFHELPVGQNGNSFDLLLLGNFESWIFFSTIYCSSDFFLLKIIENFCTLFQGKCGKRSTPLSCWFSGVLWIIRTLSSVIWLCSIRTLSSMFWNSYVIETLRSSVLDGFCDFVLKSSPYSESVLPRFSTAVLFKLN